MKKIMIVTLLMFYSIAFGYEVIPSNNKIISQNISAKHKQFIEFMIPKINTVNHEILAERKNLIYLYFIWQEEKKLSPNQQKWLYQLADDYKLTQIDFDNKETWHILLNRVDILPNSLVLAQSIIESGWGSSRFAKQGKNYFGMWCDEPGCGIIPQKRSKGASFEVAKYNSALDSVKSYIMNINIFPSYVKLRNLRSKLRYKQEKLSGITLSDGLGHYSQKGDEYIKNLQEIIRKYNLEQFDLNLTNV